jgi:hypothetical protein
LNIPGKSGPRLNGAIRIDTRSRVAFAESHILNS